jgi:hypothetical protein
MPQDIIIFNEVNKFVLPGDGRPAAGGEGLPGFIRKA